MIKDSISLPSIPFPSFSLSLPPLLEKKYSFERTISSSSYSEIYEAVDLDTKEKVAIKYNKRKENRLLSEAKILNKIQTETNVAKLFGIHQDEQQNFLVMELMGDDLEILKCKMKASCFGLPFVLKLGSQMVDRVRTIHKHGFIHRDLKPSNFVLGSAPNESRIYLIDFGLSKQFMNERGRHVPNAGGEKMFIGNLAFCSVRAHSLKELSRRDDLESLGYILIYLAKGNLPWILDEKKMDLEVKMNITSTELCRFLPHEFKLYFDYVKSLGFYDEPEYIFLKGMFDQALIRLFDINKNDFELNDFANIEKKEKNFIKTPLKSKMKVSCWDFFGTPCGKKKK